VDRVAVAGLTLTVTGRTRLTVAVADSALSVALVAVTVTVCEDVTVAGAVYRPLALMVPVPVGLRVQFIVTGEPFTVPVNCCVWLAYSAAVAGVTATPFGPSPLTV
jgi:hypothetical protein